MAKTSMKNVSPNRLRFGIALFLFAWVPLAVAILAILRWFGYLQSPSAGTKFVAVFWGIQALIGFVGIIFAGKESIGVVKSTGYKRLIPTCWHVFRYGKI